MPGADDGSQHGNGDGSRLPDALRRIGSLFNAPTSSFRPDGDDGSSVGYGDLLQYVAPADGDAGGDAFAADTGPKKLPALKGAAAAGGWQLLKPIAPRPADGVTDLGTVLFVHDVEGKRRDFATRCDADRWQAVHTVSDLIDALTALVGAKGVVRGIMISSHGGWGNAGGFRMGDDTDGDGEIEGNEAMDFVSTAAEAQRFGALIKAALSPGPETFISIEACSSAGPGNAFIKALQAATGVVCIGSTGSANLGGNWWSDAWWEADGGRAQVNRDGTVKADARTSGTNIWRPF
jgi:hypothetical protein